jgi:opacity protein-like surface antigen
MKSRLPVVLAIIFLSANTALAQKYEVSITAGALKTGDHDFILPLPGRLRTGTGFSYQLGYAQRFLNAELAALYYELSFTGTPRVEIDTSNALSPRSYSSFFITPGVKLKLLPGLRYSPFLSAGVGYARFNESDTLITNQPNTGDRGTNRAAYTIGGGLDVKVFPYLSLRGEVRDFYSGTPKFNTDILDDRQHNFMVSTGLVFRF